MAHTFHANPKTGNIIVSGECKVLRKPYSFEMTMEEFDEYTLSYVMKNKLIQQALPNVSPENREFLISEISPEGWERLFKNTDG